MVFLPRLKCQMLCILGWLSAVVGLRLQSEPHSEVQADYDDTDYLLKASPFIGSKALRKVLPPSYSGPITKPDGFDIFLGSPLLSPTAMNIPTVSSMSRSNASGGVAVLIYHKTGYAFTKGLVEKLQVPVKDVQNRSREAYPRGHRDQAFYEKAINTTKLDPAKWVRINQPSRRMPLPDGRRVIHFYRSPVKRLLSAYRFHQSLVRTERWCCWKARCLDCTQEESEMIFSSCNYECNYYSLLQAVDETRGIELEALQSRQSLENMVMNMQRWANNPDVLHLSVDHLAADFDAAMKCMMTFIGMPDADELLQNLQELDASKHPNRHVTRNRYDNSRIKAHLENHEHWGPQFTAIQQMEEKLWGRQAKLYGCPMPL